MIYYHLVLRFSSKLGMFPEIPVTQMGRGGWFSNLEEYSGDALFAGLMSALHELDSA